MPEANRQRAMTLMLRISQWLLVIGAAVLAWLLLMTAAVWQGRFVALLFPAGWCAYAAVRQYQDMRAREAAERS